MGEVYKARDTRLDRAVALKVIQSSVADSPEMRERFEREARAISALDHPNICILYDVSREGDVSFLVMQYLEGETLADRLARAGKPLSDPTKPPSGGGDTTLATITRGPIPFDTVLKFGAEIANALDAAHRRGIVHRDLKPGNVMLTKSGTKLLDFGLAKLAAGNTAPFGGDATRTSPLTSQGAILGTLHYMSPEQLEGKDVDARSDIHAFGVLLYEMLTGRRAFEGQSQAAIIAAIINADPPALSTLADGRTTLPVVAQRALDRLLARCLAKDPDDRWHSAADLAAELQWIGEERVRAVPESAVTAQGAGAPDPNARSRERVWMGVAAAAIVALAAVAIWLYPRPAPPPAPISYTLEPPEGFEFAVGPGLMGLSPDGRRLAFTTGAGPDLKLWVRELGSLAAQQLPRGDTAWQPTWSPDSRSILFGGGGGPAPLRRLDLAGGMPTILANANVGRATWGKGVVVFESEGKLHRVPEVGGESSVIMEPDAARQETGLRWPFMLPDGRRYLFAAQSVDASKHGLFLASVDSRERTPLVSVLSTVEYAAGYLFYVREGTLMAHPFDADAGRLTGEAFPVVDNIRYNSIQGRAAFSVSASGTLAYIAEDRRSENRALALFDRFGKNRRQIGALGPYAIANFSPNGRQAIVQREEGSPLSRTLHLLDVERGVFSRFTVGDVDERSPVWSHDGSSVYYFSMRSGKGGVYRRSAGGGATSDELIHATTEQQMLPSGISPDGKQLLVTVGLQGSQRIWVLSTSGDGKLVQAFPGSTMAQHNAQFSPDGAWVAYVESTGPAAGEIYLRPFPANEHRVRASTEAGGRHPFWMPGGRAIVYRTLKDTLVSVDLKPDGTSLQPSPPKDLFTQPRFHAFNWYFHVDPRTSQFLLIEPPDKAAALKPSPITVVVNFVQGLGAKRQ
jgi:Tol biopolymer transport system component/tRNA A-37 threonylcarbamoyl transferase component Bud32